MKHYRITVTTVVLFIIITSIPMVSLSAGNQPYSDAFYYMDEEEYDRRQKEKKNKQKNKPAAPVKKETEIARIIREANNGDKDAQLKLGWRYLNGQGVPRSLRRGGEWLYASAKQGNKRAMYDLADFFTDRAKQTKDPASRAEFYAIALQYYTKAANHGDKVASYKIGVMYNNGKGVQQDYIQAAQWFEKSVNQGNVFVQEDLDKAMSNVGITITEYRKAANKGDVVAQMRLSTLYFFGGVIDKDLAKSAKWMLKAARQGNAGAQKSIGDMYFKGQGVVKNEKKAFNWLHKAATQGDAYAQFMVSYMLVAGKGTAVDYKEAYKWARKSALQGRKEAQSLLGGMYATGTGVKRDRKAARMWLKKSAAQGFAGAKKALKDLDKLK